MNRNLYFLLTALVFFGCSATTQKPEQKEMMTTDNQPVITAELAGKRTQAFLADVIF